MAKLQLARHAMKGANEMAGIDLAPGAPEGQITQESMPAPEAARGGREMEELRRFFRDCTWTGRVLADPSNPSSPELEVVGKSVFSPIMDGLWLAGDLEEEFFYRGEKVDEEKCHYIVGWSPGPGEYKAVSVDSLGNAMLNAGRIEGDILVLETPGDPPVRLRMSIDLSDEARPRWYSEVAQQGEPWLRIEEYTGTRM